MDPNQPNRALPMCSSSELQALIAAIPSDLSIASSAATTKSTTSLMNLSTSSSSSSCVLPTFSEMNALSMLSLPAAFPLFGAFPLMPAIPMAPFNAAVSAATSLPPHATIESLGLINSHLYHQQQRAALSALSSPTSQVAYKDSRPRAFSSAATLQHPPTSQDSMEKRRKRTRRGESSTPADASHSVLRSLVEDDDVSPVKVRPVVITREEEEMVRLRTEQLLERVPIALNNTNNPNGPLRQLISDQDLPDEVDSDSPFRHYPKYQKSRRDERQRQLITLQNLQAAVATLCIEAMQHEINQQQQHQQQQQQQLQQQQQQVQNEQLKLGESANSEIAESSLLQHIIARE